ncbi:MAG: hypothetical protein E7675_08105 [Ruminococcaceae bacterium]|nr:hypothetical protein [Oscillospiraceae bacterium]
MELKKLDKRVLKLWYIRAAIISLALVGVFANTAIILVATESASDVTLATLLGVGIPVVLLLALTLIMPALRYKMYAWGYDDKRITVKEGVIFRKRVVIPICQIQDLHRTQGPLMLMLKLGGVTISTAGSNFTISTLTTDEADRMIDELERHLETRIEEQKNEEI